MKILEFVVSFWEAMEFLLGEIPPCESYINSLEVIEVASQYIEDKINENGNVFGPKN